MSDQTKPNPPRRLRDYRCADGSWRPPRPEGLARVLAKAGYGARPRTEALVRAGRITIDGRLESDPAFAVDRTQELRLDGEILREAERRYLALHKPAGIDCQERRRAGRWIGDYLPEAIVGLEPVGRLDVRARGLMLVSNDLGWNVQISGDQNLERRYEVVVSGRLSSLALDVVRSGMSLSGQGTFRPHRVDILVADEERTRLEICLRKGHHRQMRSAFTMLRHPVLSTVRTGVGPVDLADLPSGATRDLEPAEIQRLARPCRKS